MPAIFCTSLSGLAYEITLTRIFSISLSYHFAFMVVSIAMLGIAASGTLLSVYPKLKDPGRIQSYILLFCISLPASYLLINIIPFDPARLSWDRSQMLYLSLYYLILSFPFFCFGLIISTALSTMTRAAGHIYGADLTGAGAGSLLTLWVLSAGGPEQSVFVISSLLLLLLCIYGSQRIRHVSFFILMINLLVLSFHPEFIQPRISPYKPLEASLQFPGAEHLKTYYSPFSRIDTFRSPAVRYAPGLSFTYLRDLPEQTGMSIDAGDIHAITNDTVRNSLDFLGYLPSSLPYELSPKNEVLILEPRGGLSVLQGEFYDARNIYNVDSNPLVVRVVRENQQGFSSDIYKKNTRTGLGRSYLDATAKRFSLIDLSLLGSVPAGSFGFSEDYRFTVEAFETYLNHLSPEGMLSVNLFIIPPPRTELRILGTIAMASEELGISNLSNHIAAIRSWSTMTIIFKKSALSGEETAKLKAFAQSRRFDVVYCPGITEAETNRYIKMSSNELFRAFESLLFSDSRSGFTDDYPFDIKPVHDENPFFHYYLRLGKIREIYRLMGEKWQYFLEEGYLLPVIFMQIVFLSIILILIPLLPWRSKNNSNRKLFLGPDLLLALAYFALIGIGFMFIEISFIQKMIFPLENPSYAAAVVLSSVLISSGIGSLLSQHLKVFQKPGVILLLSLSVLAYSLLLPSLIQEISPYAVESKIVAVFFILMPAGILMGIPFPLGISTIGKNSPNVIPWALAVNGCFSVLSPILAVSLAITAGFRTVLLTAIALYLMAFCFLWRMKFKAAKNVAGVLR